MTRFRGKLQTIADEAIKYAVHDALSRHKGSVRAAAKELQIDRTGLYRVMERAGIAASDYRKPRAPIAPMWTPEFRRFLGARQTASP